MDQNSLPIIEALQQHAGKCPDSFHVPGHKNGSVVSETNPALFSSVQPFDLTELAGLDDLHDPHGVIASAQQLASEVYGSLHTQFLVGGATAGNLIMIMAAFDEGDVVLVQRDAHKSIINGLRMAKVQPVFLDPVYDESSHLSMGLSYETVQMAFQAYPEACGLILTSPSYHGWSLPTASLIQKAKSNGAAVLVDEAHGAHFPAGSLFPESTVSQGADLVVHSAHKTLPALTMAGFLHIGPASKISVQAVKEVSSMIQSSSPSYPLMASLDTARHYLYQNMRRSEEELETELREAKHAILHASGLTERKAPEKVNTDPLKLIMKAPEGYSGWTLQQCLEKEYVFTELADHHHVVFFLSFHPVPQETCRRIKRAAARLYNEEAKAAPAGSMLHMPLFGMQMMAEDWYRKTQKSTTSCRVQDGKGEQAATDIIPYPPGIPLFFKGEVLRGERYTFLLEWLKQGGSIQGGWQEENGSWYISIWKRDGEK